MRDEVFRGVYLDKRVSFKARDRPSEVVVHVERLRLKNLRVVPLEPEGLAPSGRV